MAKEYKKPKIVFESFALTQSIATDCKIPGGGIDSGRPTHWTKSSCGWEVYGDGVGTLWASELHCSVLMDEDDDLEVSCYDNSPSGVLNAFNS